MYIVEPGGNPLKIEDQLEREPQPPEGFVDSTVRLGRLQPDGSIEWYGAQEAFPAGWGEPKGLKIIPGSGKKKTGEVENMQSRPDKEEIMAKARPMIEAGMSLSQTARELGVPLGTLSTWVKKEAIAKQKAESERKVTVTKDEKPDNFDHEFDAALAKQNQPDFDIKTLEIPSMDIYIQSLALSAASLASAVVRDPLALALVKKYLEAGA